MILPIETKLAVRKEKMESGFNEIVDEEIKVIQKDSDTDYGYIKMTYDLSCLKILINIKKTYS